MYRDLGFIRVWGTQADGPGRGSGRAAGGAPYAYLIYPHKPIVAYLPQTRELLNEYCVEFPDQTRPYGSALLPESDDVLAKWMALTGDERRLIADANMHLPGRQVDPKQVRRDLWRLGIRVQKSQSALLAGLADALAKGNPDLVPDATRARQAVDAFVGSTKKLIVAVPTFDAIGDAARRVGAEVLAIPLMKDYSHDLEAMLARQ